MRLATVLTPMSDENLQLAAQCGVTDVVHRYPGDDIAMLRAAKRRIAAFGMSLSVIEGYLPIENIKLGCDDGRELKLLKTLIRQMAELDIRLLCYNFMTGTDWVRTRLDVPGTRRRQGHGLRPLGGGCGRATGVQAGRSAGPTNWPGSSHRPGCGTSSNGS